MNINVSSLVRHALFQQALGLHQNGLLAEAEACYKKLMLAFPANSELLNRLGMIELQRGRYEQGVTYLNESLALSSNQPATYVIWVSLYRNWVNMIVF